MPRANRIPESPTHSPWCTQVPPHHGGDGGGRAGTAASPTLSCVLALGHPWWSVLLLRSLDTSVAHVLKLSKTHGAHM